MKEKSSGSGSVSRVLMWHAQNLGFNSQFREGKKRKEGRERTQYPSGGSDAIHQNPKSLSFNIRCLGYDTTKKMERTPKEKCVN